MAGETVLKSFFLEWIRDQASGKVANGRVKVNGVDQIFPVTKTVIDGMKIRKYVYLDDVQGVGNISEAVLLDSDGNELAAKAMTILKADLGLLIAFEFEIKVEVIAS